MPFVSFMTSDAGGGLRIIAGAAFIAAGIATGGTTEIVIAIIGVVPLAAGTVNVCLFAPLFGADFVGRKRTTGRQPCTAATPWGSTVQSRRKPTPA